MYVYLLESLCVYENWKIEYTIALWIFQCCECIVWLWKWNFAVLWGIFFPFERWKNIKEFLIITRGYGMKQGLRQWFKSPSCCLNWIILLFWSGVWLAVLSLSVKLSCTIFALCQIYSRCYASGNQTKHWS